MKQKIYKKNNVKKILFIGIVMLILLISIIMLTKTNKNSKINSVNQATMGLYTTNVGEVSLDITNQVADKSNSPKLSAGMIPIKWNGSNWVITTENDEEWYNYADGKMANMMLNDGVYQSEIVLDMKNKKLASENIGKAIQLEEMGTIFTWIPRFAYNEERNVLYLKAVSGIVGEYTTPDIFTYKASGVNGQDIALRGIWVEKESKLGSSITTSLATEDNTYGLIGNIKTEHKALDADFIESINKNNETGIKNLTEAKAIIKVINEKVTEPIMAKLSAKGKNVTIEITKADNGIKEIRYIDGTITDNFDGTKASYKVDKGGVHQFIIIDNIGNQRLYEINVISPEIYVSTNIDNYVEFNGERWYPSGTQVTIKFADDMTGLTGYYQEINGTTNLLKTTGNPNPWVNRGTYSTMSFNLTETMKYKAKLENSLGEVLGEDEETIHIMPTETSIPSNYYNYNLGGMYPVKVGWNNVSGNRYGTETYECNTPIRDAARHMGLIKQGDANKVLYIKIAPIPQGGYSGSTRNGVATGNYSDNHNGYIFVTPEGEEIKEIRLPKINNIKLIEEDNKIKVKVDATTTNPGAKILKYYYIMDNTDTITNLNTDIIAKYIESDSNEFTFEDVQAFKNHTIRVIVKDNYGEVGVLSEVYEEVAKTVNGLQKPTIRILKPNGEEEFAENDPEIVEYDGKIWYPAGTKIEATYSETLTNTEMYALGLYGYYEYISDTTGELVSGSDGANLVYTHILTESATWKFKLKDNTGEESEEESVHLNIMPYEYYNTYKSPNNYVNNIGAIYPVRVTGDSSIRTTEWNSRYSRNRYIYI